MNWTKEQENAITIPVSDVIVSAAAGSGKTAVMAERIIRRLTDENYVDIDKILVVTYTKAAASEIKERVMKKIVEKLSSGENPALAKQLVMLNNAHFCTIHSFCLDLIRKYFYLLDIDPEARIADETEVKILKNTAIDSVLNEYYDEHDEIFSQLVSRYTKKKDSDLVDMLLKVYDFSRTMPNSDQWLDQLAGFYEDDCETVKSFLRDRAVTHGKYACKIYETGLEVCRKKCSCPQWENLLQDELDALNLAMAQNTYDSMYEAFHQISFKKWSSPKEVSEEIKCLVKGYRDSAKDVISKIKESYFFSTPDEVKANNENVVPYVKKITEIVRKIHQLFSSMKRERNMIDFSDFEHFALKLLRNDDGTCSDIAKSVSESFEEIYIDEYQDCNNIQNTIFEYISGKNRGCPNIYCVGDMKQSIYRFRDANPMLFRNKCDTYPLYESEIVNESNKILLNSNFRSRKSILNFVNSVFRQIMSQSCGELDYEDDEMLNYGGGYEDVNPDIGNIDIDIIDESDSFDSNKKASAPNTLSKYEAEAIHVAKKIKSYIDDGYILYDKKSGISRPAQYRDIVILLRSPGKIAPIFEQVFNDMNIPVYNDKSAGYFDTEEVSFLMNLLKIIDNPDDDISLAAVMKNPVFGFDENELLKFRMSYPKKDASFYECVKNYTSDFTNDLSVKTKDFLDSLEAWYEKSRYMETDAFISYLINDISYFTYLSMFADYNLKKTNVRCLIQKAKDFESTNFKGIFSFVRYVENTKTVSSLETAKVLSENDNVVRIMSIHRSKGLEFPIVFLSCLGRKINKNDAYSSYVLHKEYGLGLESVFKGKSLRLQTLNRAAIKEKIYLETMSEELRVLYVALTRPTEKLIMTGYVKNAPGILNKLEGLLEHEDEKITPSIVEKCENFLSFILLGVLRSSGCQLDYRHGYFHPVCDECVYNISLINKSDICFLSPSYDSEIWENAFSGKTENYAKIKAMLSYRYPHENASTIPGNVTVTEIKRMHERDEGSYSVYDEFRLPVPEFMNSCSEITGADLGSLVHLVMEKIDFEIYEELNEINEKLSELCNLGIITDVELGAINEAKIFEFFTSETGKRMVENADSLVREYSFKYLIDASEVFKTDNNDKLIVQGTVDAYFEDSDGCLVVVDYKTDKVKNSDTAEISNRYCIQLEHYAKALESITGKKVKEKILYLFDTGDAIKL